MLGVAVGVRRPRSETLGCSTCGSRHDCAICSRGGLRTAWLTITRRPGRWRWRRKAELLGTDLLHGSARGIYQAGSEVRQASSILLGSPSQEHVYNLICLEPVSDLLTVDERFAADELGLGCHAAHGTPTRTFREVATQSQGASLRSTGVEPCRTSPEAQCDRCLLCSSFSRGRATFLERWGVEGVQGY